MALVTLAVARGEVVHEVLERASEVVKTLHRVLGEAHHFRELLEVLSVLQSGLRELFGLDVQVDEARERALAQSIRDRSDGERRRIPCGRGCIHGKGFRLGRATAR